MTLDSLRSAINGPCRLALALLVACGPPPLREAIQTDHNPGQDEAAPGQAPWIWLMFMAAALGCAGAEPGSASEVWCASHRCDYVEMAFASDDPDVARAVADVREATGADIIIDSFGVPVTVDPTLTTSCGATDIARNINGDVLSVEIRISTNVPHCSDMWFTFSHEMVHALTGAGNERHTDGGIFDAEANDTNRWDEPSLDVLCSAISCPARRLKPTFQ